MCVRSCLGEITRSHSRQVESVARGGDRGEDDDEGQQQQDEEGGIHHGHGHPMKHETERDREIFSFIYLKHCGYESLNPQIYLQNRNL